MSYKIHQRLAQWLLMTLDRIESHTIKLTHEILSMIVGVRRACVTLTVNKLETIGAI